MEKQINDLDIQDKNINNLNKIIFQHQETIEDLKLKIFNSKK